MGHYDEFYEGERLAQLRVQSKESTLINRLADEKRIDALEESLLRELWVDSKRLEDLERQITGLLAMFKVETRWP